MSRLPLDHVLSTAAPLSRRRLLGLGGALGAGLVLAACGSDAEPATDDTEGAADPAGFVVVQRYPTSKALVPGPNRLAISLADPSGSLLTGGPSALTGVVRDESGATVAPISAPRRGTGLDVPYWSILVDIPTTGLYDIVLDGAAGDPTPFLVWDPSEVTVPSRGQALQPFDTPTTDDPRGVDPICTRLDGGPCPFHPITLTDALAAGKPVVYLVGTPAYCQTATCGPGLEFLIDVAAQRPDAAIYVHAEVYTDDTATTAAPAVTTLGLDYEPVIFVTDATGTIVRRIDIAWDRDELASLLDESLA